jgi:sporulation protein YlmC with PRC-barrel domain
MRLGELNRHRVETESGRKLGRVHDVRAEQRGTRLVLIGLCVGPSGFAEHFGLPFDLAWRRRRSSRLGAPPIPWSDIVRAAGERIIVRDSGEPES